MRKYYVIDNWDLNRIIKLAPSMDAPVRIVDYKGIPCSVHGEPLELVDGEYKGLFGTKMKKQVNKTISSSHIYKVTHPQNIAECGHRLNRFIVAAVDANQNIDPIIEVTNNGRCNLRCSQWATMLKAKHHEDAFVLTPSIEEYNNLLKILSHRLVL
ncbi:hypothetical protein [Bacillus sp. Marseille-P3661]|uniref:hypothetical protein n=1 Tax=Bacillus sp. Marseille-P3661 TaxID=1936234 RepID=UPI000C82EA27|nr:hypothetical protein [Bacillus sp. Marseille-P3661]